MTGHEMHSRERHARRSVRGKLMMVALITTGIALLVSSATLLTRDLHAYRTRLTVDLATEASILALSTGPALAFDDQAAADRNVKALSARPAVLAAAIYDGRGRLYASYVRAGSAQPSRTVPRIAGNVRVAAGRIEITHLIVQHGERLGTIYLRGRYDVAGRVYAYLGVVALVALLSLGVALVLSTLLQRNITGPLSSMASIAQHVIAKRDYSLRASRAGEDEIGLLVEAFNSMLEEVQARTRELVQSNAKLRTEVESRETAEAALKEADRRKDEFLATLAHELRNPLAPIRYAVELLEISALDARRRDWARQVIGRQVQRMAPLLDDLLDVSRITRGRLQLRISRVELSAMVRSAVEIARPLIESKQHALEVDLPPEPITLEVDPLRLSQALSNLLTNAAKYTDPGGRIVLEAQLLEEELCLTVTDNGIGLSAASIPALFEMFSQADSAIDRAEGGLGIGLALVKGLVALHGGSVQAHSEGPGRGSRFTIRLPRSAIVAAGVGEVPAIPAAREAGRYRCSVLVADDNRDAADTLALLLQTAGHATLVAHGGQEALELACRERPDAMILDVGMPDMTGYELAGRIRATDWGRRALLIAATGWGQQADKVRAAEAGFNHHLTKPVAPDTVEALLEEFARKLERRRSKLPET
ncbi:MAG: response regulator [Proteobacteria bacterium]|nr:response regulator [Pseudomonadota bacterium]